jgi:hypothetical protein
MMKHPKPKMHQKHESTLVDQLLAIHHPVVAAQADKLENQSHRQPQAQPKTPSGKGLHMLNWLVESSGGECLSYQ